MISSNRMELATLFLDLDPVAMSLDPCFRVTANVDRGSRPVLLPIDRAIDRLVAAGAAAKARNLGLRLIACTEARCAVAVSSDTDPRDRKFLSGAKTADGLPAYCGGLNAAIHRASLLACHADVVCLKTASADLNEARRFATEVRSAFPGKKLGFVYSPRPDGETWNQSSHTQIERELRELGYDHYFVTLFGSTVLLSSPPEGPWVLFDDAIPSAHSDMSDITDSVSRSRPGRQRPWLSGVPALRTNPQRESFDRAS